MLPGKSTLVLLFSFIYVWISSPGQSKINIEWMQGQEAFSLTAVPYVQWTRNNEIIILDNQKFYQDNDLEIFNPETNQKRQIFDPEKSLLSLRKLIGRGTSGKLPPPELIDPYGETGLFMLNNDLFILFFKENRFIRITDNNTIEEAFSYAPDGKKLAWSQDHDLYYYDLNEMKSHRLTYDGSGSVLNGTPTWVYWEEIFGRNDVAYWWSEQSDAVAFLHTDDSLVDRILFKDFEPAVPDIYTQKYPKAGSINPRVKVGIVELRNAQVSWVDFPGHKFEYFIRAKWLPDGRQLAVETMNRAQTIMDLFFADRATGIAHHILKEEDSGWVNIQENLYFLTDRKHFLWSSERTGYAHLYLYDNTGALVRPVTHGDWAISSSGQDVDWVHKSIACVDKKKDLVYFTSHIKSHLENHLYQVNLNDYTMQSLTTSWPGDHKVTFSPDGNWYVDHFSNIDQPDALYIRGIRDKKNFPLIVSHTEEIKTLKIRPPVIFSIPARDGFPLPAMIYKPPGFRKDEKYPVIMYVYGGPSSPVVLDKWDGFIYWNNILADHGFIVIAVDNRSATGISKILENTILLNSPTEETKDLLDVISWLKKQAFIDKERVGIWGWSKGGTMVMSVMTHSPDIKAGISVAGVSDWRFYDTKYAEMFMRTPTENPGGYESNSMVNKASDIHGRILLIQGTLDDNVHPQNTYAFANALIDAGKLFDMQIYPDYDHSINSVEARNHLYHTMLDFWLNHLK